MAAGALHGLDDVWLLLVALEQAWRLHYGEPPDYPFKSQLDSVKLRLICLCLRDMATACSNIIRRDRVRRSLARPSTELEVSAPAVASKFTIRLLSKRAASTAGHLDHLDPSIRPKFRRY
jgi:hypothetical protein